MVTLSVKDVRDLVGLDISVMKSPNITTFITEATTMVYGQFGRYIEQRFVHNTDHPVSYRVRYRPAEEITEVLLNEEDNVQTEGAGNDYTVVLSTGTVTFNADILSGGDSIYVRYIPSLYNQLIMYLAAINLLQRTAIRTDSDERKSRVETLQQNYVFLKRALHRPIGKMLKGGSKHRQWRSIQ